MQAEMRLLQCSSSVPPLPLPFSSTSFTRHHHFRHEPPPPHAQLVAATAKPDNSPKTIRYRFSQLCKRGEIQTARQLFDSIPQPTTVLWNSIIIGYICNHLHQEALALYVKMKWAHAQPDPYTYSSVLKACAERNELAFGKSVHCHILRSGLYPGMVVYNSLLNMYASCMSSGEMVKSVFLVMPKRNVVAWNTMFSWFLKVDRPADALLHFVMMLKMGVAPTGVSFVNVLPAASALSSVGTADALYGLVVKMGGDYVADLFIVSSAIHAYAELGCLDAARKIFDSCEERNAEVLNSMVCGYVQNGCAVEAVDLFLEALEEDRDAVPLDQVSYVSVLTAVSQLQDLDFARQLHAYLTKSCLVSDVLILNGIISMYSKCNSVGESLEVFKEMPERDLVSWNTIVSALVQNHMDVDGLMLVYEMQAQGFLVDAATITAILSAASNLGDLTLGKQTHAYILRHEIKFEGMETYLIDMYAKSGMIKAAEEVFLAHCLEDRDQTVWNAMISGYTRTGLINQSFYTFEQMLEQNVTPSAVSLASILPACSHSGSLNVGKAIHSFMIRRHLDNNIFLISALVDMYSKSGSISYAEKVFRDSPEKNSVTYTNMIFGYGQNGMGEKAVELFNSMKECGLEPDRVTFVAALSACSYAGLIDEGLRIFESMPRDYRLQPSYEHYACVVDMLGRVGRVEEAYMFAKQVGEECDVSAVWGSILAACKVHGDFELGKVVANKLLGVAGEAEITGYQVLLSNIYAAEGNWESVINVRRGMRTKDVGCSWIDIVGHIHCFMSEDRGFAMSDRIYEILDHLTSNMKDAGYRPFLELQNSKALSISNI